MWNLVKSIFVLPLQPPQALDNVEIPDLQHLQDQMDQEFNLERQELINKGLTVQSGIDSSI